MLFVNGRELKITPDARGTYEVYVREKFAELRERFNLDEGGKAAFMYPDVRVKENKRAIYDTSQPFKRTYKPASLNITLVSHTTDKDGNNVEWRYAETKQTRTRGGVVVERFDPSSILFDGAMALGKDKIELLFYIIYCFPYCMGGEARDEKLPDNRMVCKLVDKKADEQKKAAEGAKQARLFVKIYGSEKEGGLSDDKLRTVAGGLFVPNAATMEINALKNQLMTLVSNDPKAHQDFLAAAAEKKNPMNEMKATINKAIDIGYLKYSDKTRKWMQANAAGVNNIKVCAVSGAGDPKEALFKHLINDGERMAAIELAVSDEKTEG